MSQHGLTLRRLEAADAPSVASLIARQPANYFRYFYALPSDEQSLSALLRSSQRDAHMGLYWNGELICVFMVRGWDGGFEIPSFGIFVDAAHRGLDIIAIAVEAGKLIARLEGAKRMMIKVHPNNRITVKGALRFGWVAHGEEPETGNTIFFVDL